MPSPKRKTTKSRPFTLREKILTLALFAMSTFSVVQIAIAQNGTSPIETPRYSDARELWSERSQDNFPGSAFYFLDESNSEWIDRDALQRSNQTRLQQVANSLSDGELAVTDIMPARFGTGALASKFRLKGTDNSRYRALQCLTTAIYYEAATEPDDGQRAVGQVILNRVKHPSYPKSICGVVYQGSERSTGCQFSFTCDGSMQRKPDSFYWTRSRKVAQSLLSGEVSVPAGLATHYHTTDIRPYWAPSLNFLGTIGRHRFYKWRGLAGAKKAFSQTYSAAEPKPGPYPRKYTASKPEQFDPIALSKSYEDGLAASAAAKKSATQVKPAYSANIAPGDKVVVKPPARNDAIGKAADSGGILPKYQQSGQWINRPGN